MAGGMAIKGIGRVGWSFKTPSGILTVHSKCYLVPKATACIFLRLENVHCVENVPFKYDVIILRIFLHTIHFFN